MYSLVLPDSQRETWVMWMYSQGMVMRMRSKTRPFWVDNNATVEDSAKIM